MSGVVSYNVGLKVFCLTEQYSGGSFWNIWLNKTYGDGGDGGGGGSGGDSVGGGGSSGTVIKLNIK